METALAQPAVQRAIARSAGKIIALLALIVLGALSGAQLRACDGSHATPPVSPPAPPTLPEDAPPGSG